MSETPSPVPPQSPNDTEAPPAPSLMMRAGLVVLAGLFFAMVGFLYYRWLTVREPKAVIEVRVDDPVFEGKTVTVNNGRQKIQRTFERSASGEYYVRFLLEPGRWAVDIDRGDRLFQYDAVLRPYHNMRLAPGRLRAPATGPASLARPAGPTSA